MMARENQGLQMALIIFVMLTVVLGVLVFVYVRKGEEADRKAQAAEAAAATARTDKEQMAAECKDLKRMIGYPTKSQQEMTAQFDSDMKQFAQFPSDVLFYSPILGQLAETIKTKDSAIAAKDKENKQLRQEFARRGKEMDERIAKFGGEAKESGERLLQVMKEAEKVREDIIAEEESLKKLIERLTSGGRADKEQFKEEIAQLSTKLDEQAGLVVKLTGIVATLRPGARANSAAKSPRSANSSAPSGSTSDRPTDWIRKSPSPSIPATPPRWPRPRRRPASR